MATNNKKSTALATMGEFHIANRYEGMDPELLAELQDQMDDLDEDSGIQCRMIKIPSGGGLAYEVQGEDENDVEYAKEIDGVIVFTHRLNGYWPNAYGSDDNKAPVCSSMDGKSAVWSETGELRSCDTCPFNQYGSDAKDGRGKACKNMRRVYLMMDGDPNFYLLTVPPTSIKDVNKQLARIIGGGTPYTGMVVSFKLVKATNAGGVAYSKVTVEKKGILPPPLAAQVQEMRRQIKAQYQSMAITLNDYAAAPAQDNDTIPAGEFVDVPNDEALPFSGE